MPNLEVPVYAARFIGAVGVLLLLALVLVTGSKVALCAQEERGSVGG
jgi:hypothetical protein